MKFHYRFLALGLALAVTACVAPQAILNQPLSCSEIAQPRWPDVRGAANVDPTGCAFLAEGKASFRGADYGAAEVSFRRAVESFTGGNHGTKQNYVEALLGLAASYDAMKRFDMADQIYTTLAEVAPDSAVYNNNYGYSLMLRGQRDMAKTYFAKARKLAPKNSIIQNNAELLEGA